MPHIPTTHNRDSVFIAFDALGSSFSCVQHLNLWGINLSVVDAEVLTEAVSKMFILRLGSCSLTPRQATELFIAIGEDENMLRVRVLKSVDLSAAEAEVPAGSVLMCSQGW